MSLTSVEPIPGVETWGLAARQVNLIVDPQGLSLDTDKTVVIDVENNPNGSNAGIGLTQDGRTVYFFGPSAGIIPNRDFFAAYKLCGHNIKYDVQMLRSWGFNVSPDQIVWDTQLAEYVKDSTKRKYGLKPLAKERFGATYPDFKTLTGAGKKAVAIGSLPLDVVANYNGCDVLFTYKLMADQQASMTDEQINYLSEIELPTMRVLLEMEERGVQIDADYIRSLDAGFANGIVRVDASIRDRVKTEINLNSHQQIKRLLMDKAGLRLKCTAAEELRKHEAVPLVKDILRYRELAKLKNTYTSVIAEAANGASTYRLHARFNQSVTQTGRLCVDPETLVEMPRNLQEFPKGKPVRSIVPGDYVYSLTWDKRLCLKKVLWCGPTKVKRARKFTVQNRWGLYTTFTVSHEHLVRLYGGEWKPAGSLSVGNRLCGFVRRGMGDYAYFFPSSKRRIRGESGGRVKEHRWIYAQLHGMNNLPSRWDVHHIDHNKLNNSPSNLLFTTHSSHLKMHKQRTSKEAVLEMTKTGKLTVHPKTLHRLKKFYGLLATNHTIVAIEEVPEMQLWDLEVEETNNFFGGEVNLHNSSSEPNLQNIPTRTEEGDQIRRGFIAKPGHVLLDFDYSQIEPRLMAHFSQDPNFIKVFKDGKSVYQAVIDVLGLVERYKGDKDEAKRVSKIMWLALAYNAGSFKLSQSAGISKYEADRFINKMKQVFSQFFYWREKTIAQAEIDGGVTTLLGRFIPLTAEFAYLGPNYTIQGSAAEIMKMALQITRGMSPVATIHDEMLLEVVESQAETVKDLVKFQMEHVIELRVPIVVEAGLAKNWAEAKN